MGQVDYPTEWHDVVARIGGADGELVKLTVFEDEDPSAETVVTFLDADSVRTVLDVWAKTGERSYMETLGHDFVLAAAHENGLAVSMTEWPETYDDHVYRSDDAPILIELAHAEPEPIEIPPESNDMAEFLARFDQAQTQYAAMLEYEEAHPGVIDRGGYERFDDAMREVAEGLVAIIRRENPGDEAG